MSCLVWYPADDAYMESQDIRAGDRIYTFMAGVPRDVPVEDYVSVKASLQALQGNMTSPAAPVILAAGAGGSAYPLSGLGWTRPMAAPTVQPMATTVASGRRAGGGPTRSGSRTVALPVGVGTTTYSYQVVPVGQTGDGQPSATGTTTAGPSVLSASNFNQVSWTAVPHATSYRILRTVGATLGQIGVVGPTVTSFQDTGQTATPYTSAITYPIFTTVSMLQAAQPAAPVILAQVAGGGGYPLSGLGWARPTAAPTVQPMATTVASGRRAGGGPSRPGSRVAVLPAAPPPGALVRGAARRSYTHGASRVFALPLAGGQPPVDLVVNGPADL